MATLRWAEGGEGVSARLSHRTLVAACLPAGEGSGAPSKDAACFLSKPRTPLSILAAPPAPPPPRSGPDWSWGKTVAAHTASPFAASQDAGAALAADSGGTHTTVARRARRAVIQRAAGVAPRSTAGGPPRTDGGCCRCSASEAAASAGTPSTGVGLLWHAPSTPTRTRVCPSSCLYSGARRCNCPPRHKSIQKEQAVGGGTQPPLAARVRHTAPCRVGTSFPAASPVRGRAVAQTGVRSGGAAARAPRRPRAHLRAHAAAAGEGGGGGVARAAPRLEPTARPPPPIPQPMAVSRGDPTPTRPSLARFGAPVLLASPVCRRPPGAISASFFSPTPHLAWDGSRQGAFRSVGAPQNAPPGAVRAGRATATPGARTWTPRRPRPCPRRG